MRQFIPFNMVTADDSFEGMQAAISGHKIDAEVNESITEKLRATDALLFGRKTFKVMVDFRAGEEAFKQDLAVARRMGRYFFQ